ncbi:DUF4959 domain-containing protein [Compostibacter hankyongensis]|uniref:DUF4959 domain-containing protein n=1 Tax=Compostibacter hankyongensis TaxID=1007089 RepID=A0ABP8FH49_9BACT
MPACKQDSPRGFLEHDNTVPGAVSNVSIVPLSGAAKISYDLPEDLDLLYVEANYEIRPGVKEQVKASFFDHSLTVQGFGDTIEYPVALYAVDRSGNKSQPVTVNVKPLLSAVQQTSDSLSFSEDFGGIYATFQNKSMSNIVITLSIKDSLGDWMDYDKYYTSLSGGSFSMRGLPPVPTTFGMFVQDRWDNYSDTLIKQLTPLFEKELEKSKFKNLMLPGDAENIWDWAKLWDNKMGPTDRSGWRSDAKDGLPVSFTMDLGVTARLSRFRIWQVHDGREYTSSNFKQFEIWGSATPPSGDGSWDGWTLLKECEVKKPSGPGPDLTDDDIATAAAGDEFVLPLDVPAARYIRFKVISTFASPPNSENAGAWVTEVSFWGQDQP